MKYRLGDICTITKGETGIMKAIPGAYTMVALGEANKTHNEFQFDTKAVIIPLVSSTGHGHASMKRVKYQEEKFALGNILCAVIPKDENFVLPKYLHIYLHWNREELLVSQMKGMANVSLSIGKIADVLVTVPSLEKQRQIVEMEQKLVAKELIVEKLLTDQLTQLENLNQAILQEAVQGKLVPQNPKDEPASELLKRIKSDKLKSDKKGKSLPPIKAAEIPFEIPESWVWCKIDELVSDYKNDIRTGPFGTALNKSEHKTIGIPVWGIESISKDGRFTNKNKIFVCELKAIELKSFGVRGGDLIISRSGTIGELCMLPYDIKYGLLSTNLMKISVNRSVIMPEFFCHIIKGGIYIKEMLTDLCSGSTRLFVTQTILSRLIFPLPPLSEQTRIVAEIEKQLAKTKQLKEHIIANQHATEQLLKALLHGAFEPRLAGEVEENVLI